MFGFVTIYTESTQPHPVAVRKERKKRKRKEENKKRTTTTTTTGDDEERAAHVDNPQNKYEGRVNIPIRNEINLLLPYL